MADGSWGASMKEAHTPGAWTHLAMTFDGAEISLYRDGALLNRMGQDFEPATKGVPVRVGFVDGLGDAYFKGLINDVRVYNRALSDEEIADHFRRRADRFGLEVSRGLILTPRLHAKRGELVVEADLSALEELPAGVVLKVALWNADAKTWVADATTPVTEGEPHLELTFSTDPIVAGRQELRATLLNAEGVPVGIEKSEWFHFPARAQRSAFRPGMRILNNLVLELLNMETLPRQPQHEFTLENPRHGWVFFSSTADAGPGGAVSLAVDADKKDAVIVQRPGDPGTAEAFRLLPSGEHTLRVWCDAPAGAPPPSIGRIVVRSIPETMQCGHPSRSLAGYGDYDFKFLEKDALPNLTTLVGGIHTASASAQQAWKRMGRRFLLEQNIPSLAEPNVPVTAERAYKWWTESFGFTSPIMSGVMADEFSQGDHPSYDGYIEAIKRMAANKAFDDKVLYAWVASRSMHTVEAKSKEFAKVVLDSGCRIGHEAYLSEKRTPDAAQKLIENKLGRQMRLWEIAFPGIMEQMIVVLGYESAPPESFNVHPSVDYKVFLDMQFHHLATSPDLFGLAGVMVYKARYADEENVRWAGRLFRHYCIEGNTDLLSERYGYKYDLDHVVNPDFDDGLNGWTVRAAQEGSLGVRLVQGMGRMQGRVVAGAGNNALWMKRCEGGPNAASQEIRNLQPGNWYSLKVISADYGDWQEGKSENKRLPILIRIEGAGINEQKSFTIPNHSFARLGPFRNEGGGVPYHNYHWMVFRPTTETATLTISDWADDQTPGGPIGQELMLNFVEIQPYFEGG